MTQDSEQPRDLEQAHPEAMDRATYSLVVGPALKAAAEVAARRGHRYLFDDMPAMLTLVDIVTRFAALYRQHYPEAARQKDALLSDAAASACVMVFQEVQLPSEAIGQCLTALQRAYQQLQDEQVINDGVRYIAMAWSYLVDEQRDAAHDCLKQACQWDIAAIESWQQARQS